MTSINNQIVDVVSMCSHNLTTFSVLKLCVNNDKLRNSYISRIEEHNNKLLTDPYPDSGFDLLVPEDQFFSQPFENNMIDFHIKTEMCHYDNLSGKLRTCPFFLFPRSSMSKTPLILANHTGVIDSGYRGSIKGAFKWLKSNNDTSDKYIVEKNTRLLQISHPSLCPIYVILVNEEDLSSTSRNEGGFGSTGK